MKERMVNFLWDNLGWFSEKVIPEHVLCVFVILCCRGIHQADNRGGNMQQEATGHTGFWIRWWEFKIILEITRSLNLKIRCLDSAGQLLWATEIFKTVLRFGEKKKRCLSCSVKEIFKGCIHCQRVRKTRKKTSIGKNQRWCE